MKAEGSVGKDFGRSCIWTDIWMKLAGSWTISFPEREADTTAVHCKLQNSIDTRKQIM